MYLLMLSEWGYIGRSHARAPLYTVHRTAMCREHPSGRKVSGLGRRLCAQGLRVPAVAAAVAGSQPFKAGLQH